MLLEFDGLDIEESPMDDDESTNTLELGVLIGKGVVGEVPAPMRDNDCPVCNDGMTDGEVLIDVEIRLVAPVLVDVLLEDCAGGILLRLEPEEPSMSGVKR